MLVGSPEILKKVSLFRVGSIVWPPNRTYIHKSRLPTPNRDTEKSSRNVKDLDMAAGINIMLKSPNALSKWSSLGKEK